MAMMMQGGGGRRRRRHGRRLGAMNEINMTPFIDVVLVLLIIFMVAAPLMTVGVPLDLPQTRAAQLTMNQKPITLSIRPTGQVYLQTGQEKGGDGEVRDDDIVPKIAAAARDGMDERIYVRGDKKVDYGRVAQIMAMVTGAGYKRVALVTESEKK